MRVKKISGVRMHVVKIRGMIVIRYEVPVVNLS